MKMNKEIITNDDMVSVKLTTPADIDINESLDKILGDSDLIARINELVLEDTNERYIRELINRNKKLEAEVKEANTNKLAGEKIKLCLDFIDDLLPKYMEEKSHIISGDDWELNRSIYVMSTLRDLLMGFRK